MANSKYIPKQQFTKFEIMMAGDIEIVFDESGPIGLIEQLIDELNKRNPVISSIQETFSDKEDLTTINIEL